MKPDFDVKAAAQHILPLFVHENRLKDQPLIDDILAMCERFGAQAFARNQVLMARRPDSLPDLPNIKCPTLVMCGRQDALIPLEENAEIAAGIPNATFVVIEDCGHLSSMEQPHAVSAVLRYWLNAK